MIKRLHRMFKVWLIYAALDKAVVDGILVSYKIDITPDKIKFIIREFDGKHLNQYISIPRGFISNAEGTEFFTFI